jgi:AcrR family transcriptional regulator
VPRAKQRTPELRERVLAQAVGLLSRDGVAGFTTRKVAQCAATSTPAVYELFGGKGGLVREVFFEGFRQLGSRFERCAVSADPRADVTRLAETFRSFALENPVMLELMYARPFAAFAPGPAEVAAGQAVANIVVERIKSCIEAGVFAGDAIDIAHVLMSTCQGLAAAENAGRLGTTRGAADRRWRLAIDTVICGLRPTQAFSAPRGSTS